MPRQLVLTLQSTYLYGTVPIFAARTPLVVSDAANLLVNLQHDRLVPSSSLA